jgi:uncharacterized membrane protein
MKTHLIALIFVLIITPAIVIFLEGKYNILKKVGAVLMCYGAGLAIGNLGILPEGSEKYQDLITQITIPLSLPLILFSMDIKKWARNAGSAFGSLLIGVLSVLIVIFIGFWIFQDKIENIWQVSGMLVGIYTGGTPNMAAIKSALNVSQELYIMTHTYEMSLGAIYLIFVLSVGQRVLLWFLPAYKSPAKTASQKIIDVDKLELEEEEEFESYDGFFEKKTFWSLVGAFSLSVAILGLSYAISLLFPTDYKTAAIILLITTFGIAASFIPKIKKIKKTFQLGMYLILIFSITVASMADVSKLANISFSLFYYVGLAMFGSHLLHIIIAKFFKIDADTVLISGSALICSPPFVPVVAGALKNKEIILTGLVVGIAGYAIGNFLGISVAYILKLFIGVV